MNQKPSPTPEVTALDGTFAALAAYAAGSGRALLWPIDEAVRHALGEPKARREIERRLLEALKARPQVVAVEYICSKLALVGSTACVPALAELLSNPGSATAARNALEKIPGAAPARALGKALARLGKAEKVGAIQSLGTRRDAASAAALVNYLKDSDPEIAAAAACALGEIGSTRAARMLKANLGSGPRLFRAATADAALACAEHLLAEGHQPEARSLYQSLLASAQPPHVRQAASRGLDLCAAAPRPGSLHHA